MVVLAWHAEATSVRLSRASSTVRALVGVRARANERVGRAALIRAHWWTVEVTHDDLLLEPCHLLLLSPRSLGHFSAESVRGRRLNDQSHAVWAAAAVWLPLWKARRRLLTAILLRLDFDVGNLCRGAFLLQSADVCFGLVEVVGEALVGRIEQVLDALLLLLAELLHRVCTLARLEEPIASLVTRVPASHVASNKLVWREHLLCLILARLVPRGLSLRFLGVVQECPVVGPPLALGPLMLIECVISNASHPFWRRLIEVTRRCAADSVEQASADYFEVVF